ncbi:MAG: putative metal-binding motif-containing protein [Pseudomonadota bacterium]
MRTAYLLLIPVIALSLGCKEKDDTGDGPVDTNTCPPPDQDQDGDCQAPPQDCDDNDPYTYDGADEVPYDGKDNDCAGDGDLVDWDGDGYVGTMAGGDDCNDGNPEIHPGAEETCQDVYNGVDRDCDGSGQSDDCDGDGYDRWEDCNDDIPESYPGAEEVWYDGIDGNCDMEDDYDQDGDGQQYDAYGGDDCDDTRADVYYGARELLDGVDHDCNGEPDRLDQADAFTEYMGDNYYDYDYYIGFRADWIQDMDGDGLKDIVACGPYWGYCSYDKASYVQGRCYVVPSVQPGSDSAFLANQIGAVIGSADSYLGFGMAVTGDLDGDGIDDLAAGAPLYAVASTSGAALVYSGADIQRYGELSTADAIATLYGTDYYGFDVAAIPDLDGDGVPEVLAGKGSEMSVNSQAFHIWSGATVAGGGLVNTSAAFASFSSSAGYGGDTRAVGDLDGDGLSEVATGVDGLDWVPDPSGKFEVMEGKAGKIYLLSGADLQAGGTFTSSNAVLISGSDDEGVGWKTSWTYDADGDGYDEFLASAFYADSPDLDHCGAVYVIPGEAAMGGGTASSLASLTIYGAIEYGYGTVAEEPADFDGDGAGDLVMVHFGDMVSSIKSRNYIVLADTIAAGGATYAEDSTMFFASKYEDDLYGWSAAFTDYDGDGDDDAILGAYYPMEGKLWAFESDL